MNEIVHCDSCPAKIFWDKVHRVEMGDGTEKKLCDACCPNCFKPDSTTIETIP